MDFLWVGKYSLNDSEMHIFIILWFKIRIGHKVVMEISTFYLFSWSPFYYHGLTLIPPWISKYIHFKMWDEMTYSFLNFNDGTVED